jgi:succinate-semialdehyde dehydrogenase/glutarate-semialdehyde dehydrogenase
MQTNSDDISKIMTLESGKPLAESHGELEYARSFVDFFAAEAVRCTGADGGFLVPTPFTDANNKPRGRIFATHQAVGVAALMTPWNFPAAMLTRKIAPALAAGCTVVAKPAHRTPLTAVALYNLARVAGLPEGVSLTGV